MILKWLAMLQLHNSSLQLQNASKARLAHGWVAFLVLAGKLKYGNNAKLT
ncbi:hypothetical protein CLV88_11832 [Shimia abyssi]|uniref:Uncharacterized protein n=1 Tax=Shimia abyssi TaxID=1662395 RepID=A0A2P8F6L5_9RHOB|nr:hypothetical protein CLV88_11832 [Shimia abyssi]